MNFQTSDTIDPRSSVSNQWFNTFTERLLHRKSKALAQHVDDEGVSSKGPKFRAEDDSQTKFMHASRGRPMRALVDGFETDQRQIDMSEGLFLPYCGASQTLGELTYPDNRNFEKRLEQAAIATQSNSLTCGNPTIVGGTLTPQLILHKDQPLETLTETYREELFRPGMPPYLAHR